MNLSKYLYVFNYIHSKGAKNENVYCSGDVFVWHDVDGYTCYIGYKDLILTIPFYSKHTYHYQDKGTLKDFAGLMHKYLPEQTVNE